MKKQEYLKLAILNKKHYKKKWIISILALTKGNLQSPQELDLLNESWGYSTILNGEKVKIEDAKAGEPLFTVKDRVQVDPTWMDSIDSSLDVPLGNLLFNAISIYPAFGKKYKFITGKISISDIEGYIAPRLNDTPEEGKKREDGLFYCDELNKFMDSIEYIVSLSNIFNQSSSQKSILTAPGLNEYKEQLIKEYGDLLQDPIKLVEFDKKLQAYDDNWLKGDPTEGTFMTGKVKNVARKKMHLSVGAEPGFENKSTVIPITKSLEQGWDTNPKEFVSIVNGVRYGSLSRGKETIKGGVTAKYLLRAGNNFSIKGEDCGSVNGIITKYDKSYVSRLAGRSIILPSSEVVYIKDKEQAKEYTDKYVILRSPAYCRNEGDSICRTCAGDGMSINPQGVSISLTEMSNVVLYDFMKAMHDTTIQTTTLDIDDIFS